MILYHFTSRYHLPAIMRDGALAPVESNVGGPGEPHKAPDVVWLTTNPERRQGWMKGTGGYANGKMAPEAIDKGAVRITVDVPDAVPWVPWARERGIKQYWLDALANTGGRCDPNEWYIVERPVPCTEWLTIEDTLLHKVAWERFPDQSDESVVGSMAAASRVMDNAITGETAPQKLNPPAPRPADDRIAQAVRAAPRRDRAGHTLDRELFAPSPRPRAGDSLLAAAERIRAAISTGDAPTVGLAMGDGTWTAMVQRLHTAVESARAEGTTALAALTRFYSRQSPGVAASQAEVRAMLRRAVADLRRFVSQHPDFFAGNSPQAEERRMGAEGLYRVLVGVAGSDPDAPESSEHYAGSRYSEALEHQAEVLARLGLVRWPMTGPRADAASNDIRRALIHGETFWWGREPLRTLEAAAPTFPESWTLTPASLPVPYGFVWFERPLPLERPHPPLVGFFWGPLTIADPLYPPPDPPPYPDTDPLATGIFFGFLVADPTNAGRPAPVGIAPWSWGETFGAAEATLVALVQGQITEGLIRYSNESAAETEQRLLPMIGGCLRYAAAAAAFLETRALVRSRVRAQRETRRRLGWKLPPELAPAVNVVTLRRPSYVQGKDHEPEEVDWSCRWWVRAHWHTFFVKDERGNRVAKAKYLEPYIKGPADRPLKPPPDNLWAVIR